MKNFGLLTAAHMVLLLGHLLLVGSTCKLDQNLWLSTINCKGHLEVDLTDEGIPTTWTCLCPKIGIVARNKRREIIGGKGDGDLNVFMEGSASLGECTTGQVCCYNVACVDKEGNRELANCPKKSSTGKENYMNDDNMEEEFVRITLKIRKRSSLGVCVKDRYPHGWIAQFWDSDCVQIGGV